MANPARQKVNVRSSSPGNSVTIIPVTGDLPRPCFAAGCFGVAITSYHANSGNRVGNENDLSMVRSPYVEQWVILDRRIL